MAKSTGKQKSVLTATTNLRRKRYDKAKASVRKLRRWFSHDPEKFEEFKERYIKELENKEDLLLKLVDEARRDTLTLIYSAKDENHNSAVVLKEVIEKILTSPPPIR
ncbi:DUF488 family protein [Hydrogenobacter thermophilus]|uniref:DUF488 domain-containing protein n=1 Tax=Hydrogenobacter thermophilus TaxID=940 RepID=UPI0009D65E0D